MESSEDDAGTATNASRRASAREKDVGLAEDVNATSSLQQKPSQVRSSGETPAMSEDNFDGDSVPSPSSQDVNTSTEAILDMIDEIVDGPDAPKRLLLPSEFVDSLNEELATTSYNLNIIQESAKNLSENITPLKITSPDNNVPADSEISLPKSIDTPAECSILNETPTEIVNHKSVDLLPASSSLTGEANVMSTNTEDSLKSETSTSCPLPNIPSSSEEQTVQTISDVSISEPQDRTVKCVTSSDSHDNVTVESAESTSSDSSVSESKFLFVDPQNRSPLRRRLVRPGPCDRRPDSTVSSTVDSQNISDNVTTAEQSSSENIAKDVTSSSDAVPIIHGNVKPEEISNVSEINFCKAETSVSPPKKIKLIRHKNTGNINRETPLNIGNVLADNEQCQSTSYDNHSVSAFSLSQSSDTNRDLSLESNSESEKQLETSSSKIECVDEHPQPTTAVQPLPIMDDTQQDNNCKQMKPVMATLVSATYISPCDSGQEMNSLPTSESSKHVTDDRVNDVDMYNTHDNEDYIPLHLPPSSKMLQSKSRDLKLRSELKPEYSAPELIATDHDKSNESKSGEQNSGSNVLHTKSSELEADSKACPHDINSDSQKISTEKESTSSAVKLKSDKPGSQNIETESMITESKLSCYLDSTKTNKPESKSHQFDSCCGSESKTNKSMSEKEVESRHCDKRIEMSLISSELQSKCDEEQLQKSDILLSSESNICNNDSKTNETSELSSSTIESINKQHILDQAMLSKDCQMKSEISKIQSEDSIPDFRKTKILSTISELERNSITDQSQSAVLVNCLPDNIDVQNQEDLKKVPPIKLNLSRSSISETKLEIQHCSINKNNILNEETDSTKQVPKLTIKLKQPEEIKSPVPKVTIKPIRPPAEQDENDRIENVLQVPCVKKINIKPIVKPEEHINDTAKTSQLEVNKDIKLSAPEQVPCITKLNIKPILKPPEKINDIHRKSSSSEISESECSENDETTSTSDQASASDHGASNVVPKVTIKLGKPGTESEGKFYMEKNVPKLTIKGIQQEEKLIISQSEEIHSEKVPKLTIKTVTKTESQPLSPKLTIKPLKPPDSPNKEGEVIKMNIPTESFSSTIEGKESQHVPKITIKPVTRMDGETRTPKKSITICDSSEHIRAVTKLNIKPIWKPADSEETSENFDDKVPVVTKLNIKPVLKPKDNDADSSVDEVPKITKLNIKPLKNPEDDSSDQKDCAELNAIVDGISIPVVTKINIKPIVKPQEDEKEKDSENLSSETGNSSDDNGDNIPVVTKLNIKPIMKPEELLESSKTVLSNDQSIPTVTKLNIKPLIKPGESSPSSPKKEHKIELHTANIPMVTKLNIKPVVRPDETEAAKTKEDNEDKVAKNPPLVMKINMKSVTDNVNHETSHNEKVCNSISDEELSTPSKIEKLSGEVVNVPEKCENKSDETKSVKESLDSKITCPPPEQKSLMLNCVPEIIEVKERISVIKKPSINTPMVKATSNKQSSLEITSATRGDSGLAGIPAQDLHSAAKESKVLLSNETHISQEQKNIKFRSVESTEINIKQTFDRQKVSSVQNCTLLKKLLENTRDTLDKRLEVSKNSTLPTDRSESTISPCKNIVNSDHMVESDKSSLDNTTSVNSVDKVHSSPISDKILNKVATVKLHSIQELTDKVIDDITKPLEITITDKITNQSSDQDSPRIILKINKTDHGPSAKIITEDNKLSDTPEDYVENTQDINDKLSPKRNVANSRRKQTPDTSLPLSTGKRLRSSRIVENTEKSQIKRQIGKRPSIVESTTPQNKESELTTLQAKRLKLGQLLSGNKPSSITTPVLSPQISPTKTTLESKPVNHSLLNNENCSKNGNSKLHNILSNLQVKQRQSLSMNSTNCPEKVNTVPSDTEFNTSMSSSDTLEVAPVKNTRHELQQMIINENSDFQDLMTPEESSQDPLEVGTVKPTESPVQVIDIPKPVELTPQPKKRGRPRKLPVSEGAKPVVALPVPALEERPQRSLRLMRDRPTIISKPRGRGRGRGGRRALAAPPVEPISIVNIEPSPGATVIDQPTGEIDPMSSRIKLPRMTEALDKMPSMCATPLSSRRRNSSGSFSMGDTPDLKAMESPMPKDDFPNTPEPTISGRGRGGRGSRGGRGRTPRGRGRGRGGGRGAMYMKETLGIYGRVCGPATTTVQLFEEETCMMDDNATPAKPSHLLDEDSQSSVKSSTTDSNKMKKSKFADLFDSNKVWTAADVKEYMWPSPEKADEEQKVMMIQEQVAMFLGVKSFKRRYPELKRRTICGEERDYVLSKGLVTEALCDLGITAVDASEVLDIMLSDYPHKYEEFRSHQRQRQLTGTPEESMEESKLEEKVAKVEVKMEKPIEQKPDLPKVDPEKTRLDMAAAAVASAAEWNARLNALRRGACADLQSLGVLRPRAPPAPAPPRLHVRPPAGFYPHALLPGQYQHAYTTYTPEQLRYFPLNTVLAAPPAPPSVTDCSSESEPDWGSRCSSSDDSDAPAHHSAKRKKLTKVKRVSHAEASTSSIKEEPRDEVVDLCRVCKLRLEANRKYTHERFLVCANCNAKLHPSCVELNADTIRKCREYPWQCAECKTCYSCRLPADDDKMLFCDLCDRGFHIYCVGLDTVPSGRWHCVECAICKSCGARSPAGLAEAAPTPTPSPAPADWHHQTRRGPGGHKVYSHSLCTPCARAYRIGRYCPLCERSFIGPKGTMQLVICKLCDRQLHQDCVRQTVSALNVLDYTCAECRRGGITSRAAAVRLAPRTIATLFMAKRRFNKYAHRQYMQSRLREMAAPDAPDDNSVDLPDEHSDPLDVSVDVPDVPDAPE